MKFIALIDCSKEKFKEIHRETNDIPSEFADTECDNGGVDVEDEAEYIKAIIAQFSSSTKSFLAIRFSGKLEVAREVGDDCSELIVPFSFKQNTHLCYLNPIAFQGFIKNATANYTI